MWNELLELDNGSNWKYDWVMSEGIYDYTMAKLQARVVSMARLARETGIPYETLKKIAHRRTPNPGVRHVQVLADYFRGLEGCAEESSAAEVERLRAEVQSLLSRLRQYEPNAAPALTPQAPVATNPEAKEGVHG